MLREIHSPKYQTARDAQRALTLMRKKYRVALRGSVVIGTVQGWNSGRSMAVYGAPYSLHVNLIGTGFSAAEFSSALGDL